MMGICGAPWPDTNERLKPRQYVHILPLQAVSFRGRPFIQPTFRGSLNTAGSPHSEAKSFTARLNKPIKLTCSSLARIFRRTYSYRLTVKVQTRSPGRLRGTRGSQASAIEGISGSFIMPTPPH